MTQRILKYRCGCDGIKVFDHKGTPLESQSQEIRSGVQSCKVTIPIGFEGEEIRFISGGNTVVVKVTR
jgi:hypothetical protein